MRRVLRCSLSLDRSPQLVRGRCVSGHSASAAQPSPVVTDDPANVSDELRTDALSDELRHLLASMEHSVHEAESARRQSLQEFQQLAVELAVTIAGELLFRAIDADQFNVAGLVWAAIERLGMDAPLSIGLHPLDLRLLESPSKEDPPVWRTGAVTLRPDGTLQRGHCRASNGATALLSEWGPRLEEIRESLWEGLDDAQIERRQAAGVGSTLKRFPDRRETA